MKLHELHTKLTGLIADGKELLAKEDFSDADETRYKEIEGEIENVKKEIERHNSLETRRAALESTDEYLNKASASARPAQSRSEDGPSGGDGPCGGDGAQVKSAAVIRRSGSVKHFKGADAAQKAYDFGMWFLAAFCDNGKATKYCQDNGLELRAGHVEGNNSDGGFLVPTQFDNEMIDLREDFGVFRRNTRIKIMTSDSLTIPRRVGGLTAVPSGEA